MRTALTIISVLASAAAVCACGAASMTPEEKAERKAVQEELSRLRKEQADNELVSDGYTTIRKRDRTFAADRLVVDEKTSTTYTSIVEYLRGRVSGLTVGPSDGTGQPSITIRGKNSINSGTEPLFIVDGTPTDNIMWINPHDVASVDVLKDASAAIYGSRGANGVIIINTKTGDDAARVQVIAKKAERDSLRAVRKSEKESKHNK